MASPRLLRSIAGPSQPRALDLSPLQPCSRSASTTTSGSSPTLYPPRLAGLPSALSSRPRPLTFPLGSSIGFLVGFTVASLIGYSYLIQSHQSLVSQNDAAIAELNATTQRVQGLVANGLVERGELEKMQSIVGSSLSGFDQAVKERQGQMERIERRVNGVEEENLELRKRLWKLGEYDQWKMSGF